MDKFLNISGIAILMFFLIFAPFQNFWLHIIPHCSWLNEAKIGNFPASVMSPFNTPYCGAHIQGEFIAKFLTLFSVFLPFVIISSAYGLIVNPLSMNTVYFLGYLFLMVAPVRVIFLYVRKYLKESRESKNAAN